MNSDRFVGSGAAHAARAETAHRIGGAVVAMLEVLLARSSEDPGWRVELAAAAFQCARTSRDAGLPGFAEACERYAERIRDGDEGGQGGRFFAENWVSEAVTFSAGALEAAAVEPWLSGLWETAGDIDPVARGELVARVAHEAGELNLIATVSPDALELDADAGGAVDSEGGADSDTAAVASADAPADEGVAPDLTVARDELAMLAQACQDMAEEFGEVLGSLPTDRDDPRTAPAWQEALERYCERVEGFASAVGFVGIEPVAELLRGWVAGSLSVLAAGTSAPDPAQRAALREWPTLWAHWLDSGEPAWAEPALALHEAQFWPVPGTADAARRALAGLRLIASRQVLPRTLSAEDMDLSTEIPADAEQSVVANLLTELPALTQEFGEHVAGILAGDRTGLPAAQRIAHTLKGAANTVGIAGIANLTHSLEDVLQILARRGTLPEPMRGADLADAADCLAEMAEAVAGHGPPPENAAEVFGRILVWADALAREETGAGADELAEPAGDGLAEPTAAATVAPPLDAEPTSAPPDAQGEGAWLRVPAQLMDTLLNYANEATILLAQVQESAADLEGARRSIQTGGDRLVGLSDELERLVDASAATPAGAMPVPSDAPGFDPLEMQTYGELHTVSRRINEAAADGKLVEQQVARSMLVLRDLLGQVERLQADIRETALRTRMVAAATLVPRLRRVVRQAARMAGKEVELHLEGGETSVELRVLQALADPLAHLLRNAVDHGIEHAAEREAAGKPAAGVIALSFQRIGPQIIITCRDDGRGLDAQGIRERASALALPGVHETPGAEQLAQWILSPGFSTRAESTQLSGRGIGLDVVQGAVRELRGRLEVAGTPGAGVCFTLTLPVQLAALPVLVARSATHVLALSVRGVREILSSDGLAHDAHGELRFAFGSGTLRALRLEEALGLPADAFVPERGDRPARESVVLVGIGDEEPVAIIAPELAQARNVVVRPLPAYLPAIPAIEGAAVLGDGAVAPVIDLPELLATRGRNAPVARARAIRAAPRGPLCLVVDDSVSVRRTLELFLRDLGFEVEHAADGIEALGRVDRVVPDLLIVDLEMPRMNGVELTRALRSDARTAEVPIIMITSRSTQKHRQLAVAAGIDAFLVKPYGEDELASLIAGTMHRRVR